MKDAHDNYWLQLAGRRSTRRRLIGGGASAAAAVGLAACSSSNNNNTNSAVVTATKAAASGVAGSPAATGAGTARPTTSAATSGSPTAAALTPKKGGTITIQDVGRFTKAFDTQTGLGDSNGFWQLISNLMVYPDPKTALPAQTGLVASWEQVDPLTLNLKVRQGVKFSPKKLTNGRALVAKDIAYNLERITGKYDPQRIALYNRRSGLAGQSGAAAVDDTTVKVSFSAPNSLYLAGLSDWRNGFIPPELVDKDPDFKNVVEFSGTGPFMVDSWDDATLTGHYVPNPNYWEQGLPYLAGVQEVNIADPAAALAAFVAGKTDFMTPSGPDGRASVTKNRPDAKILSSESTSYTTLRFNQSKPTFTDPRVRRAIFLALNYKEINDAASGPGFWDYNGPLVSGMAGTWTTDQISKMPGWDATRKQQDIADAKALMTAAGFPDGKITFGILFLPPVPDSVVRIQAQLQAIWPAMKVNADAPTDGTDFGRRQLAGDFDSLFYGYVGAEDPILEASVHFRTGNSRNYTKISDPELDAMVDAVSVQFDAAKRVQQVDAIEKKLLDNMFAIPVAKGRTVIAQQARVQGFAGNSGLGTFTIYDIDNFAKKVWIA